MSVIGPEETSSPETITSACPSKRKSTPGRSPAGRPLPTACNDQDDRASFHQQASAT